MSVAFDRIRQAEKDVKEAEKAKQFVETLAHSKQEYLALRQRANQRHYAATRRLQAAEDTYRELDAQERVHDITMATREKNRAVLADKLQVGIDRAAWGYDSYIAQNGNALGISFTEDFKNALTESAHETNVNVRRGGPLRPP